MGMAKVPLANGAIGERAQQGARANDRGCHVSCSEQHEPRQPRSWLIFDVRRSAYGAWNNGRWIVLEIWRATLFSRFIRERIELPKRWRCEEGPWRRTHE